MENLTIECPSCATELECDSSMAGDVVECPICNSALMIPMSGIQPGTKIAGFEITRKLGSGAMGEVWLANQVSMHREVAVKILPPALTSNTEFVDQFLREARNSGRLQHANIVTAFDAGVDREIYYLAMTYVDGESLEDKLVRENIIAEKEALVIIREIAKALDYAWNNFNMLHRDIKPSNIMLDQSGKPKLMDMGVAKSLGEDPSITIAGTVMGTPFYMSPEQAKGEDNIDFRSDLYSLGATLFHLVCGKVPYEGDTSLAVMTRHVTDPLPSPMEVNPQLSPECSTLLQIMLAKNPDERQQTWNEAVKDINLVLKDKFPATELPECAAATLPATASQKLRKQQLVDSIKERYQLSAKSRRKLEAKTKTYSTRSSMPLIVVLILLAGLGVGIYYAIDAMKKQKQQAEEKARQEILAKKLAEEKRLAEIKKIEEEKQKKQWDRALRDLKESPTNFDKAIRKFTKIRDSNPEGPYRKKAEAMIKRLNKDKETYLEKQKEEEKRRLAEEKRIKRFQEMARRAQERFLEKKAKVLISGDFNEAWRDFQSSKFKDKLPDLALIMKQLALSKEMITDTLKKLVGKEVNLVIHNKRETIKITKVTSSSIQAELFLGKAKMKKKFKIRDISPKDRLKLLEKMDTRAKSIYAGVEAVKKRQFKAASKYFDDAGPLAEPLKKQLPK